MIRRRKPLRPRAACPHCSRSLCACGKPVRLKKSRVNPINRANRARLYARNFGDYADTIRAMPCWWCERPGPSDPAHTRSRGAGGDRTALLPMCRACHEAFDTHRLDVDRERAVADARALWERLAA